MSCSLRRTFERLVQEFFNFLGGLGIFASGKVELRVHLLERLSQSPTSFHQRLFHQRFAVNEKQVESKHADLVGDKIFAIKKTTQSTLS